MNKKLKPCPFRVHGERNASWTVTGEYYYNETFMPCMGERCAAYWNGRCMMNTASVFFLAHSPHNMGGFLIVR